MFGIHIVKSQYWDLCRTYAYDLKKGSIKPLNVQHINSMTFNVLYFIHRVVSPNAVEFPV